LCVDYFVSCRRIAPKLQVAKEFGGCFVGRLFLWPSVIFLNDQTSQVHGECRSTELPEIWGKKGLLHFPQVEEEKEKDKNQDLDVGNKATTWA